MGQPGAAGGLHQEAAGRRRPPHHREQEAPQVTQRRVRKGSVSESESD